MPVFLFLFFFQKGNQASEEDAPRGVLPREENEPAIAPAETSPDSGHSSGAHRPPRRLHLEAAKFSPDDRTPSTCPHIHDPRQHRHHGEKLPVALQQRERFHHVQHTVETHETRRYIYTYIKFENPKSNHSPPFFFQVTCSFKYWTISS